jgi:hypothetical protein
MVCCLGNTTKAQTILQRQQQEQVSFERNTIWKDMVGQERRAATVHVQVGNTQVEYSPSCPIAVHCTSTATDDKLDQSSACSLA